MVESRQGKVLLFTLKEVVDVLVEKARKSGQDIPPCENVEIKMDQGTVRLFLTLPLTVNQPGADA